MLFLDLDYATISHLAIGQCLHRVRDALLRHGPYLGLGPHAVAGCKVHHRLHLVAVAACGADDAQAAGDKWQERDARGVEADGERVDLAELRHHGHIPREGSACE
jgi:hypothetical protein